jgi:hypothetical protein
VVELWEPGRFDEIVVSTLPPGTSKWLEANVPQRIEQETEAPVTHVVAHGSDRATFDSTSGAP